MIPRLSPAELRTAVRVMAIYTEATAQILAEEQAAEERMPSGDVLAAERREALLSTPEGRADFAAYLDRLETTHGADRDMAAFIARSRALLPANTPTAPHAARLDRSPQVAAATEGDPSHG